MLGNKEPKVYPGWLNWFSVRYVLGTEDLFYGVHMMYIHFATDNQTGDRFTAIYSAIGQRIVYRSSHIYPKTYYQYSLWPTFGNNGIILCMHIHFNSLFFLLFCLLPQQQQRLLLLLRANCWVGLIVGEILI